MRRSKSAADVRFVRDPLRGVKRPINKTDILPLKRLKTGGTTSTLGKQSSFNFKLPTAHEKKIAAITSVVKSSSLSEFAKVLPNKQPSSNTVKSKTKANEQNSKPPNKIITKSFKATLPSKSSTSTGNQTTKSQSAKTTMKPAPYVIISYVNYFIIIIIACLIIGLQSSVPTIEREI